MYQIFWQSGPGFGFELQQTAFEADDFKAFDA